MSGVDAYETNTLELSEWWKDICTKALTLDITDFLDDSYSVASKVHPLTSKRKLRSSQISPLSQQRENSIILLDDDEYKSKEEEEEEEDEIEEDGPQGSDEMATPTSCPSTNLSGSSATSMLPPLLQMPKTLTTSGRPQRKRKRDTITSIAKQLVEIQQ